MFNQVFISYAKEDYLIAEELYDYLLDRGYSPWLDKKKLKVGSNWDYEIKKSLKEATFVILLLSSVSVKKRGYVQKEYKYALEYAETKLIDDIYIIPILIDECIVPDPLNKFQWNKLNGSDTMEAILDSLNTQREIYLKSLSPESIEINAYSSLSIDLNVMTTEKVDYSCDLPIFYNNSFFDAFFVNTFIQQKALEIIQEFASIITDNKLRIKEAGFYLEIEHFVRKLDKNNLSLVLSFNSYSGGMYPNTTVHTLNFAFKPNRILRLGDVIHFNNLHAFLMDGIQKYGNDDQKELLPNYVEYTDGNIDFTFDEKTLYIDFSSHIPHVIYALSSLEIPLNALHLTLK